MPTPPPYYRSQAGYDAVMAAYDAAVAAGPQPVASTVVATRFGATHVLMAGPEAGPPLLLFHGWNGNAAGLGGEFPFLFEHFRVYMPDVVGHVGKSAPTRPKPAGSTYGDWAADVLDGLGMAQSYAMGISGGGWLTLKLAAHHPQRVRRAVALSTDGLASARLLPILTHMLPAAIRPNAWTLRRFLDFMTGPGPHDPSAATDFMAGMSLMLRHVKTQRNPGLLTDAELAQITAPLLVLMGEYERVFDSQKAIDRARAHISSLAAAEVVPAAGHVMTIDRPAWLARRVLAFLQD